MYYYPNAKLGKPSGTHPNTHSHTSTYNIHVQTCTDAHTHTTYTHAYPPNTYRISILSSYRNIANFMDSLSPSTTSRPTTDISELPIDVFELFSDNLQEEIVRESKASDGRPTIPVVDTHHCGRAKSFLWLFYLDGREPSAITR